MAGFSTCVHIEARDDFGWLAGGESVRTGVDRPHSHTFAQIQEILVREAQIVRWRPRASALSRVQSVLQYGPEYGQKRSADGRVDRVNSVPGIDY